MTRKISDENGKAKKVALGTGLLAASLMMAGAAQGAVDMFIKLGGIDYAIAGVDNRHTVFKDASGKLFYFDGKTGDKKFLANSYSLKQKRAESVTVVGIDKAGNTIMKNARGQTFFLDPDSGAMNFQEIKTSK